MTLPTVIHLINSIDNSNHGFVKNHYPYNYAHDFLIAYPEVVPKDVANFSKEHFQLLAIEAPARQVSHILTKWAESINKDRHDLAVVLADAWVIQHIRTE